MWLFSDKSKILSPIDEGRFPFMQRPIPSATKALTQLILLAALLLLLPVSLVAAFSTLSRQQRHQSFQLAMAADPPNLSTMDNWRSISLADDDIPTEWSIRPLWSESAFQSNLAIYNNLINSTDDLSSPLHSALSCLHDALRLYQSESLILSFNGGKDAAVILYLTCAALAHHYDQHPTLRRTRPRAVYFDHPHEFELVQEFTRDVSAAWDLDLWAFAAGTSFPEGLSAVVDAHTPQPLAFVLGTRQDDPNAQGQTQFIPSSSSYMPPFLRVNPILHWTYADVWECLRMPQFRYCSLYDQGYTSLGTTLDTLPCPALQKEDGTYLPAYRLQDWSQERAGRIPKKKKEDDASAATTKDKKPTQVTTTTVALLIIGDEILKGFCNDTNTGTAARALQQTSAASTATATTTLQEVAIVADTLDAIVPAIQRLSKTVDILITSGGVGPTHDDVTIQAVAAAVPSPLTRHEAMAALIQEKLPDATAAVVTKMATLPACAALRTFDTGNSSWPILQCDNIFVLPGVPQFFAQKMETIARHYAGGSNDDTPTDDDDVDDDPNDALYKVVLGVSEFSIVDALNAVVDQYAASVTIGSYPQMIDDHGGSRTVLTLQGEGTAVRKAIDDLVASLPDRNVVLRVEAVDTDSPKPRRLSLLEDE